MLPDEDVDLTVILCFMTFDSFVDCTELKVLTRAKTEGDSMRAEEHDIDGQAKPWLEVNVDLDIPNVRVATVLLSFHQRSCYWGELLRKNARPRCRHLTGSEYVSGCSLGFPEISTIHCLKSSLCVAGLRSHSCFDNEHDAGSKVDMHRDTIHILCDLLAHAPILLR